MDNLIKEIAENIPGLWQNEKYELALSLQPVNTFFFTYKEGETISGKYSIEKPSEHHYIILRLFEEDGAIYDYVINELSVFDSLIISHEGEKIHLTNRIPE